MRREEFIGKRASKRVCPVRMKLVALLAFLLVAIPVLVSCAAYGRSVIEREGCLNCHSFKGRGGIVGPDLTAVTGRRSDEWIRRQIKHSRKNNPRSRMPQFEHLSAIEIRSILAHLKS